MVSVRGFAEAAAAEEMEDILLAVIMTVQI
jgi:hypothetical protein